MLLPQNSQFSIFEGADEDVVLLHGGVLVAVGVDDLVETSCGRGGSVRLWERAGKDRGREREKEKEDNINDEEKQRVGRVMHFTHEGH